MNNHVVRVLDAYEAGLEDGFYDGYVSRNENLTDEQQDAYRRGYDKGVALYCVTIDKEGV